MRYWQTRRFTYVPFSGYSCQSMEFQASQPPFISNPGGATQILGNMFWINFNHPHCWLSASFSIYAVFFLPACAAPMYGLNYTFLWIQDLNHLLCLAACHSSTTKENHLLGSKEITHQKSRWLLLLKGPMAIKLQTPQLQCYGKHTEKGGGEKLSKITFFWDSDLNFIIKCRPFLEGELLFIFRFLTVSYSI